MKKSISAAAAVLAISTSVTVAQTSNALHSFMMANPLIAHPAVFRELQETISDEITATEPGAQLDEVYRILADARLRVLNAVYFELFDTTNGIGVHYLDDGELKTFVIPLPDTPAEALTAFRTGFDPFSKSLSKSLTAMKPKTREAYLLGMIESMKSAGIPSSDAGGDNVLGVTTIARMSVLATTREIELVLGTQAWTAKQGWKKEILEAGNRCAVALRTKVADALTAAERRVREAITSFSKVLLAANSGLSIREGAGSIAGGLHLSFRSSSKLQFGFYVNGQFNKSDSNMPTDKMFGGQVSWALSDKVQFDLLYSSLIRGEAAVGTMSYEMGVGLLYRSGSDYLISTELFNSKDFDQKRVWMLGFGFRSVITGSPSLFVGWPISPSGKVLVQFSIPVLGS